MDDLATKNFSGKVNLVRMSDIRASDHNPRGTVDKNESFERLVASIERVGVLVPIVLAPAKTGEKKYELVDGERRFLAASEIGLERIPAHILESGNVSSSALKKLMFHLHMTREQWGAIAQCRSLVDTYPALRKGVRISEKTVWVKRLAEETGMPFQTARDRIHFLAWSWDVKKQIFEYDEQQQSLTKPKDIYSYVLALEASIVEPSTKAFPNLYNHGRDLDEVADEFRGQLFRKVVDGMEHGLITTREQIRAIAPLFTPSLSPENKRAAQQLFKDLVKIPDLQFDDIRAEMSTKLPELLQESPPKPQRVTSVMRSLEEILKKYNPHYFETAASRESTRKKLKNEFLSATKDLRDALTDAINRLS